jgi:outer membrane protein assembly factor BamB
MNLSRRAALLGASGLLAGCETVTDLTDRLFGTTKVPLRGERRPILTGATRLEAEPGAADLPMSLPPAQTNTDWPQPGGPATHAPGHVQLGASLAEAWRSSIGSGTGYRQRLTAPPIVADGAVYAMDAFGWVTALDASRGGRQWQTDTRPRRERDGALGGAIAFEGGTLYAATGLAEIMAINPADGSIRWRAALPAPARGGLTVAGGRLLVPTVENHLVACSTEDGREIWRHRASPVPALPLGLPSPAVEGETVVAGFASGEVVALRLAEGRPIWTESLGNLRGGIPALSEIGAIAALPVIDRGRVIAVGMGNATIALDLRSGRRIWERELGGPLTAASVGDWVFLLTGDDELICLGRDDGRIRWVSRLPSFQDEARRRNPIAWGPPIVAGERVLIAGNHGQIAQVNPATGAIASQLRLSGGSILGPAVANGTIFYLTDSGSVAALRGA